MISMNCHGVVSIHLGTPQYFPPTAPENHSFWSMEILLNINQGVDTLRIVTYAHEQEHLSLQYPTNPQKTTAISVLTEEPSPAY